jgi:acetoin utilization deacetylase AcuC-like enzyme
MGKTGYFTHRDCWRHEMGPGHPECPERLAAIEDRLLATGVADALEHPEVPLATAEQITRAHSAEHVELLEALDLELIADAPAGAPRYAQLDPDTALNRFTVLAARRAAGAAVAATDAVIAGQLDNAFCAVRPPGHHACRDKAMGFCVLNNVAIAARHAIEQHGLERVAVVDFDVHHGNGTEDILLSVQRHRPSGAQHAQSARAGLHQGHGRARADRGLLDAAARRLQAADDLRERRLRCAPR